MSYSLRLLSAALVIAFAALGFTQVASAELDFPNVADLEEGDLFKTSDVSTVYYFGEDDQRYGFPNEMTYYTWYENFDDVVEITDDEMDLIPLGGMVTYKPQMGDEISTRLLMPFGSTSVYVPIGYGMLAAIEDGDAAEELFGADWTDYVDDLPDVFRSHYILLSGTIDGDTEFDGIDDDDYAISDDLLLEGSVGFMMYDDPLRFAAEDEGEDCGEDYCAYNEATVEQGNTVKFVNYSGEEITVREENNEWTTGPMASEDIVVLTADSEPGEYYFYADEDEDMVGILTVE